MKKNEANQPEAKFTAGAVSATIWNNPLPENKGTFNTISLTRTYKDKAGNWQHTPTLRLNDLPKASVVLNKAYEHLLMRSQEADA